MSKIKKIEDGKRKNSRESGALKTCKGLISNVGRIDVVNERAAINEGKGSGRCFVSVKTADALLFIRIKLCQFF